ncbi:MAG: hypothetical protein EP330_07175 [Deltaproteobacteria bacterium]|nr:MAG: hypothetical protein EP330_07175 [Deltaproteobacteria bacterium]
MHTLLLGLALATTTAYAGDPAAEETETAAPEDGRTGGSGTKADEPAATGDDGRTGGEGTKPEEPAPATDETPSEDAATGDGRTGGEGTKPEEAASEDGTEEPEKTAEPEKTEPEPPNPITDPASVIAARAATTPDKPEKEAIIGPRPNKPMLGVAAGLAAAGLITYSIALNTHNDMFNSPDRPYENFEQLKGKANTFSAIGTGLGAAALGTGIGAFIVGEF